MIGIQTWKYLERLREQRRHKFGLLYQLEIVGRKSYNVVGEWLSLVCGFIMLSVISLSILFFILWLCWSLMMWAIPDRQTPPQSPDPEVGSVQLHEPDMCGLENVYCDGEPKPKIGMASFLDYQLYDSCATRDWPKETKLLVSANGKSVTCVVRDFGPELAVHPDRIIDLNRAQFAQLAPTRQGIVEVKVIEI